MTSNMINSTYSQPIVKPLGTTRLSLLRKLAHGTAILSVNGGPFHDSTGTQYSEPCIEALRRASLVVFEQCGPDTLLHICLVLTNAGETAALDRAPEPQPTVEPWTDIAFGQVYAAMHSLTRYAVRECNGETQRNLLDAIQQAMNKTMDADKLTALSAIRREMEGAA
jgi:hypothetical protein